MKMRTVYTVKHDVGSTADSSYVCQMRLVGRPDAGEEGFRIDLDKMYSVKLGSDDISGLRALKKGFIDRADARFESRAICEWPPHPMPLIRPEKSPAPVAGADQPQMRGRSRIRDTHRLQLRELVTRRHSELRGGKNLAPTLSRKCKKQANGMLELAADDVSGNVTCYIHETAPSAVSLPHACMSANSVSPRR